ncbi:cysteine-rich receptor-like protein kinase 8, partial [Tanacetum coccineum]
MIDPLPTVENACSLLQQEESQRLMIKSSANIESSDLLSKGIVKDKCSICGFKWHPPEKYWKKVGYPSWHAKYKGPQQIRQTRTRQNQGQGRNQRFQRTVGHVESGIACLSCYLDLLELVRLDNGTLLKDVLVVPSFKFSLLSMPKLTRDSQCVVSVYPKFCIVQDLTTKKVTGLGRLEEGLYHLVNVPADKVDSVFSSLVKTSLQKISLSALGNKIVKDSYGLLHHRLGHVSDAKLKQIHDIFESKSSHDNFLSCPMVKFTKLPYSVFLTIVDDCSRGTWIYLLEQKCDSFEALKSFIKFVATQFDKQVKIVRSDNALEFVKSQCGPELISQGIVHQTSCVDRSQQNGRVERKHRHILDTARAQRFHLKLPLKFWGDCVTTAAYLINKLPSFVVENLTPYEILLKKTPDYANLRVFGCLAMVSSPSGTPGKFNPRGVPYVFLVQMDLVNFKEAVADPAWCTIMDAELKVLKENITWELTKLHAGKKAIGSYWIFKTKLKVDGTGERKKARLVVQEEVYMKPPLGHTGKGCNVSVVSTLDHQLSKTDYSLFVNKEGTSFTDVLVYVDDLLIIGNDESQINSLKAQLSSVFHMKDLGELSYFLGLEVCKSPQGIFISQHKHTKELLKEGRVLNNKPYKLHMEPNLKLQANVGTPLHDPERLLRYLLNSPGQGILLSYDLAIQLKAYYDSDLANCPMTRRSTTGYYILLDLGIKDLELVDLFCDNQAALYIAANPVFHARIKHIEVDCHYVRYQLKASKINPSYVHTKSQLANVFTKVVTMDQHTKLLSKLGVSRSINSQLEG